MSWLDSVVKPDGTEEFSSHSDKAAKEKKKEKKQGLGAI